MQRKFIDRTEKEDAGLPQKKRISDEGVIGRVVGEIVNRDRIVNRDSDYLKDPGQILHC